MKRAAFDEGVRARLTVAQEKLADLEALRREVDMVLKQTWCEDLLADAAGSDEEADSV